MTTLPERLQEILVVLREAQKEYAGHHSSGTFRRLADKLEASLTQQQGGEQEVGALVGKWRRLASYEDEEGELEVGSESAVRLIRCADELEAALQAGPP